MPCGTISFQDTLEGHYLKNHVIHNVTVSSLEDVCEIRCALTRYCVSYNLGPEIPAGRVCELSGSDHIKDPQDLVEREGFSYRATKVRSIYIYMYVGRSAKMMFRILWICANLMFENFLQVVFFTFMNKFVNLVKTNFNKPVSFRILPRY